MQDVEDALRRQNVEVPAGRIESRAARVQRRRAAPTCNTPEQFDDIVAAQTSSGYPVRLRDVGARRASGAPASAARVRFNGEPSVSAGRHQAGHRQPAGAVRRRCAPNCRRSTRDLPPGHDGRHRLRHLGVHRPLDQGGVHDHRRGRSCWWRW
ncbi:MAG: efflux RND transporter permease subunit [Comamonadaceae bacterium]|nr:efflux RND transporter permease subunit [Comamonadaceae bacterium]